MPRRLISKPAIKYGAPVALVAVIAATALAMRGNDQPKSVVTPTKTSSIPTTKQNTTSAGRDRGYATDNSTKTSSTPASQWLTSDSGAITVKQPVANSTFKSGDTIAGSAKVNSVNYRLVDDQVGIIAQGALTVSSGRFSASLSFQTSAKTGHLDIYSQDSGGSEINKVRVPLKF